MQATSSLNVPSVSYATENAAFLADLQIEAPKGHQHIYAIAPIAKPRVDILSRRRKRHTRRAVR